MSVEIREEPLELLTYVLGPPDPNPPFQRRGRDRIYPYPLLDDIGEEARSITYRSLVVENEYLRVTVLPELGGRLYSGVDKLSGEEIFYRNNVVKPGLIALRGAWISGGVEWNFPRGHTVNTVSPVDARTVEGEDGSATIWVGTIEQVYRMSWQIGIRLRPGVSVIETEVRLANRTALPHPYYFWANAAVPARDDMHLIYPGTRTFTWRHPDMSWPIHEGKDMSRYTAFEGSNDIFMVNSLEGFFGVHYEERDFGVVHLADVHDAFGKKFFTWGTSHHGKMWSAALSDSDGPYCEIQSGRFVDQATWRLMPPHHAHCWTECWYPVRHMGGFSWANREAAVRITRRNGRVECAALTTRRLPRASVRVTAGRDILHERTTDLSPERPLRVEISDVPGLPQGPLTLSLLDADAREIIRYTENQPPRTIAVQPKREEREDTPGEVLHSALRAEERADFDRASELYEKALAQDPACTQAAVALGRLGIERRPEDQLERLAQAAAAAPQSAEAAYFLGVAQARAGKDDEAETALWRAAQSPGFAHAARLEIGRIALRGGRWAEAADVLRASVSYRTEGVLARCLLSAALRRAGRPEDALEQVHAAQQTSPVSRLTVAEAHFCAAAQGRPRVAARYLQQLGQMMPNEPDPWLDIALDYASAGMLDDAASLLRWASTHVSALKQDPLAHYLLAYCLTCPGDEAEAAALRKRASRLPAQYVFPHHCEMERVLRAALASDPTDARARHYLGALLYAQGRREEALGEWQTASADLADLSVLQRDLALAHREVGNDLAAAEEALRLAVKADPNDRRLYLELNEVMRDRGADPRARLAVLDSAPPSVRRRGGIAAQQIACCLALQEWDCAVRLLTEHVFHRWEAEFRMRLLYLDAYLGRGIERFDRGDLQAAREDFEQALEYPDNVRIGRPPQTSDARAQWCAAAACDALGDGAAATVHWEAAAAESHHDPGEELTLYRALSLEKLGRTEEAHALLAKALELARQCADSAPDDAAAQFSLGLTLQVMGRGDDALPLLSRAVELDRGMHRAQRLLEGKPVL